MPTSAQTDSLRYKYWLIISIFSLKTVFLCLKLIGSNLGYSTIVWTIIIILVPIYLIYFVIVSQTVNLRSHRHNLTDCATEKQLEFTMTQHVTKSKTVQTIVIVQKIFKSVKKNQGYLVLRIRPYLC